MEIALIIAIAFLVQAAVAVVLLYVFKKPEKNISIAKRLALVGVLTALSTICNIFTIGLSKSVFLSFIAIPCFIAGVLLGPIEGFAVGFIGDLIGAFINPMGPYMPIIGIASGMWGLIPGVLFTFFKGNDYVKTVISFLLCFVICTVFLNTFGLWLIYGLGKKTFMAYLLVRLPFQSIVLGVNMFISLALVPAVKPIAKRYFS